jgi:hypothetical protein
MRGVSCNAGIRPRWRWVAAVALVGVLATSACSSARSASSARGEATAASRDPGRARPQDTFTAQIDAATGRLRGARGRLTVYLHPGPGSSSRRVTIVLRSARCTPHSRCLSLDGRLSGTITRRSGGVPDTGRSYALSARGRVSPIGSASAAGVVRGTGFVARGRESLLLQLTTPRGSLALRGQSPHVPGFSSP